MNDWIDVVFGIAVALAVAFLIVMIVFAVVAYRHDTDPKQKKKLYDAWRKAYPQYNRLTQDEWETLRVNDLLPGQVSEQNDGSQLATGIAVGTAVGMSVK